MEPDRAGAPASFRTFAYDHFEVDEAAGVLRCHYRLDDLSFVEVFTFGPDRAWSPAAYEAARLVFLLAGVSYYKAGAPPVIDLGATPMRPGDADLLRTFYVEGLGEYAFRNAISLEGLEIVGGSEAGGPVATGADPCRPLVPFGGGIDSIVSVDVVTQAYDDVALFVVHRAGDPFEAIELAASRTALPLVRVEREVDPQILRPADPARFRNGHVPITGILSAVAVLTAVLEGRGLVVMSNEWSASQGNLEVDGRTVNHQFSKSEAFEGAFRAALARAFSDPVEYFSLLRPRSELWVAQRFAGLERFHDVVHSCNRAFHLDPAQRQGAWCGECDKCCFIDLILAPFLSRDALAAIFGGREPLDREDLLPRFRDLLGTGGRKPFECVGDVDECRTAAALAAARPDRVDHPVLTALVAELGLSAEAARRDAPRLLAPIGRHWVPDALLPAASLV